MNKEDKVLMEKYDITSVTKTMFFYKDFKYDSLDRALSYARHEAKKAAPETTDVAEL
jgi:hypothetical protein